MTGQRSMRSTLPPSPQAARTTASLDYGTTTSTTTAPTSSTRTGTTSRRFVTRLSSAVILALAGCGSQSTHVVRASGQIGPLHVDRSGEAAVIAFAGKPDATATGTAPGYERYRALGYGCRGKGFD